jgi:hypothetical protein
MDGSDASTSEGGGVYEFRRGGAREKTAHDGTIKKVLLDEKRQSCVSMGEDRVVRSVCTTLFCFPHLTGSWETDGPLIMV